MKHITRTLSDDLQQHIEVELASLAPPVLDGRMDALLWCQDMIFRCISPECAAAYLKRHHNIEVTLTA
ncbi:hypothetical protein [Oceanisphaera avium]|uniref:Uncharacterized protein n=1 Tax=Oceanisphaera avium TaxID=1903694 RepID=A0A1Y0CZN3_9GAMM|nr:hypothetical protein [Oceanisphaera avium]ART80792.1 hypothetical protein CBP12_12030 [Oceanisphaera avium]